jgi:hypothetical protein
MYSPCYRISFYLERIPIRVPSANEPYSKVSSSIDTNPYFALYLCIISRYDYSWRRRYWALRGRCCGSGRLRSHARARSRSRPQSKSLPPKGSDAHTISNLWLFYCASVSDFLCHDKIWMFGSGNASQALNDLLDT